MVRVCFRSKALRDRCADTVAMTEAWGREAAGAVRRRLQQIEAMTAFVDVDYLPCLVTVTAEDARIVTLHDRLELVVSPGGTTKRRGPVVTETVVVEEIRIAGGTR